MTQPGTRQDAYAQAGVDIAAGNDLVRRISPLAKATARAGSMGGLGGFGAFFDVKGAGYRDPVLVAATDGVGTKLRIAIETGRHQSVGIDLVAMCVNDLIVQGAEPLFFLDYFATGKLEVGVAETVIAGIADGCKLAGCALIGGETAEMPGMYAAGDYDLAGFSVGAVERDAVLTGSAIAAGDVVLGLASSGVHSNGFSLVRKVVGVAGYDRPAPFDPSRSLGEALLTPTRIYVRSLMPVLKAGRVKGLAHITGGGLLENIPRILPDGLGVRLDAGAWALPPVFCWLKQSAAMSDADLARTFNCGIGMVVVCARDEAEGLVRDLSDAGERVFTLGSVVAATGEDRVEILGTETAWRVG